MLMLRVVTVTSLTKDTAGLPQFSFLVVMVKGVRPHVLLTPRQLVVASTYLQVPWKSVFQPSKVW